MAACCRALQAFVRVPCLRQLGCQALLRRFVLGCRSVALAGSLRLRLAGLRQLGLQPLPGHCLLRGRRVARAQRLLVSVAALRQLVLQPGDARRLFGQCGVARAALGNRLLVVLARGLELRREGVAFGVHCREALGERRRLRACAVELRAQGGGLLAGAVELAPEVLALGRTPGALRLEGVGGLGSFALRRLQLVVQRRGLLARGVALALQRREGLRRLVPQVFEGLELGGVGGP